MKTVEVGIIDANKPIYSMEFEPRKSGKPALRFEGNDLNSIWIETVKLVRDDDLWDDYTLNRVERCG